MLLGLVGILSACGNVAQPAGSIKVTLTEYKFDPGTISVPAGTSVFYLVNSGTVTHDMAIKDSNGATVAGSEPVSPGDVSIFTASDLAVGTYKLVCTQAGHEASGMVGVLVVTEATVGASPSPADTPSPAGTPSAVSGTPSP